jgi:integrase/recombinase XerC
MGNQLDNLSHEAHPSESVARLPLADVVREYMRLYAEGVSHTARAKQLDSDKFLDFLRRYKRVEEIEKLEVRDWSFSSTQRFVDDCLKQGEAPATVARRLATLKHMGRILAEKLSGFINPAREVKPPRQQASRPKSISADEITQIKDKARTTADEKSSFITLRNRTLLNLLLDTGLRADEIRTLRMSQLGDSLEWIRQVRTKGRRFRDVYITSAMRESLKEYLLVRKDELSRCIPNLSQNLDAKLPLFISLYRASPSDPKSFEMGAKTIWRSIRSCSVDTKLHPHLLRHTYATELLEDSRDIRLVAQALGHSDVRVTMRYTERGNEEVAQALERTRRNRS